MTSLAQQTQFRVSICITEKPHQFTNLLIGESFFSPSRIVVNYLNLFCY